LVLFFFATAQPKGFAVTLILGVLVSMLTAVLFTRAMLGVLAGFTFFNRPSLMGVSAGQIEVGVAAQAESSLAASRRRRAGSADRAGSPVAAGASASTEAGTTSPSSRGTSSGGRGTTSTSRKRKKRR
jgi:hypothetical protein